MNPTISVATRALADVSRFLLSSLDEIQRKGLKSVQLANYFTNLRIMADQILAKKLANSVRLSHYTWQLDLIDQENYYLHNHPDYFLSLVIHQGSKPYASLIYNPLTQDAYGAVVGLGAYMNSTRIRVNKHVHSDQAIVACDRTALLSYPLHNTFKHWTVTGSSMLDVVRLASGAVDGVIALHLNEIQLNATRLLLQESGGMIESLETTDPSAHALVAASQHFIADLKTTLIKSESCPA